MIPTTSVEFSQSPLTTEHKNSRCTPADFGVMVKYVFEELRTIWNKSYDALHS